MKIDPPKYRSSQSVAQAKPIYIDATDPRVSKQNYGKTVARAGAPVIVVDMTNKSLVAISSNLSASISQSPSTSTGSNPDGQTIYSVISCTLPLITNLTATWSGKNIVLQFTFDTTIGASSNFFGYQIQIYDGAIWWPFANKIIPTQSSGQVWTLASTDKINWTLTLPASLLAQTGIPNATYATQIEIEPVDSNFLTPSYTVATISGTYTSDLPAPIISVAQSTDSYTVTTTNFATAAAISDFNAELIEEYVTPITDISQIPTAAGAPWVVVNQNATKSPIGISAPDDAHRWVRARFQSKDAGFSAYSNYVDVTPTSFIPSNTYPPVMVTSVTSGWASLGVASPSGNDVLISYVQPDPSLITGNVTAPYQIKVKLVPVINGTPSTQYAAYFYHTFISLTDSSFSISQQDLFNNFGQYYGNFVAYVSTLSAVGVESISNFQTPPFSRTNPLLNITPVTGIPNINNPNGVFRVYGITNGYTVDWDLPAGAIYAEVYESTTPWSSYPTDDDEVVYAGVSPAVVQLADYNPRYILIHYYDKYGNYSNYSSYTNGGAIVSAVDVGKISLITNPIKISTNGSIFSGAGDSSVYPQVFFNDQGLFAYDSTGAWTTEIVNNAGAGQPTFYTKNAKIADWTITPSAIESTLIPNTITTYTGLSASNPNYAFWAGSTTSENSSGDAPFYVTPSGSVYATNLSIVGNGSAGSYLITAGGASNFSVTQNGVLTALQANITGTLHVGQNSTFTGNVFVSPGGIITAGASQQSGSSVQIDYSGIKAYNNSSRIPTTIIYGNANGAGITFSTTAALIGNWNVNSNQLTSSTNNISLDSSADSITILANDNSTYGIKLSSRGQYDGQSSPAISIGNLNTPTFSVTMGGHLEATSATINGDITSGSTITGSSFYIDGNNNWNGLPGANHFNAGNGTTKFNIDGNAGSIKITTTSTNSGFYTGSDGATHPQSGNQLIQIDSTGMHINGMQVYGNDYRVYDYYLTGSYFNHQQSSVSGAPFTRTMIYAPMQTGDADGPDGSNIMAGDIATGFAIYYGKTSTGTPNGGTGLIGDLFIEV